jgi:hypothetical protein
MAETVEEVESPPIPLEDIAAEALDNYKLYKEVNAEQEKREVEDLSWQDPDNMWDPKEREGRGPATIGGLAVPKRPTMSVPMHKQPISLVLNQAQAAHLGINVHPVSETAEDDTAEVQQDLYRAIERDSNASVVRFSAFKRSTWCGRGYYRVNVVYDESTGDPFDLKIVLQRIVYQGAVFMDPSASEPDFSDAQWGGVSGWMTVEKFKATYPEADLAKATDSTAAEFYKLVPDWVRGTGDRKSIQVAEYFRKHYTTEEIKFGGRTRKALKCSLWRYVLAPGGNGLEVVEFGEWNGPDIPLVPCIADELEPYDDKRRFFGMVRPTRDPCRIYNYIASQAVQKFGVAPLSPWLIGATQLEGFEPIWAQANLRAFSYLPWNDKPDNMGQRQNPPVRTDSSASGLGDALMLLGEARSMIQSATATPDVSLGVRDSSYRSGKAEEKLQRQSEAAKTNYLENYASITLRYEAKVVLGMMAKVYDRPGRVAKVIDMHGKVRSVMLNAKFVKDPKTQQPIRVTDEEKSYPNQIVPMERNAEDGSWAMKEGSQPLQNAPEPKTYDLSKGSYNSTIDVGKTTQTRAEQATEQLEAFTSAVPQLAIAFAPAILKLQDFPGHDGAAEIAQRFVDHEMPWLSAPKDGEETPEQLRTKLQQAEQQIQQQGQQLEQAAEMLKTEQIKHEAMLQKAEMDNAAKVEVERTKAMAGAQQTAQQGQIDERLLAMEQKFDLILEALKAKNAQELEERKAATAEHMQDKQALHAANQSEMDAARPRGEE